MLKSKGDGGLLSKGWRGKGEEKGNEGGWGFDGDRVNENRRGEEKRGREEGEGGRRGV